ncbi:MAG: inositol monophosphatase, partial [Firmicutes bacterium]|nr:inositol monophosphatase [Bacillota bacterium]
MNQNKKGIQIMQLNYDKELAVAKEALQSAGRLLKNWSKPLYKEWKGSINPVTSADKQSEEQIITLIKAAFPNDIIVSEEKNPIQENAVENSRRWYLDPLDGTVNFIRGLPHWCISIALVNRENKTVCGVVYAPIMEELFSAVKGIGAWCNDEKIEVSKTMELNRAVAASGFPYSFEDINTNNLTEWNKITPNVLTVRSLGAAAQNICEVAKGRIDIFWEQGLERWDLTAAALICSEAGAEV